MSNRLGSPIRKKNKVSKILKTGIESENVDIPSLNTFTINENIPIEDEFVEDSDLEEELMKYNYIPLSTIIIKDNNGDFLNKYIKAVNQLGQKVYILIDIDVKRNVLPDLTLIDTKQGSTLPYSLKAGAMKMAGLDASGIAIESDDNGLCMLESVMDEENDNFSIVESNFTFTEEQKTGAIVENYGCHMSYPVVKLSEIRVNNKLVVEGANAVTRKLRNCSYETYLEDMKQTIDAVQNLQESHQTLLNLFETNALELTNSLCNLEEWNNYYLENKPVKECDIKKHNLIIHNMRIRNDYIGYLICGLKKVSDNKYQIDKINNNIKEYIEFFNEEFEDLNRASKI
jgi:hypothetical protein